MRLQSIKSPEHLNSWHTHLLFLLVGNDHVLVCCRERTPSRSRIYSLAGSAVLCPEEQIPHFSAQSIPRFSTSQISKSRVPGP